MQKNSKYVISQTSSKYASKSVKNYIASCLPTSFWLLKISFVCKRRLIDLNYKQVAYKKAKKKIK